MDREPRRTAPPSPQTSDLMRRFKSRDTKPEVRVRQALHARGLRFRVHRSVPGLARRTIDIAFPTERVAVFIDGCYWHGCPQHGRIPETNSAWWNWKIGKNVARDRETSEALEREGWTVLRLWEHEPLDETVTVIARTVRRIRDARTTPRPPERS